MKALFVPSFLSFINPPLDGKYLLQRNVGGGAEGGVEEWEDEEEEEEGV